MSNANVNAHINVVAWLDGGREPTGAPNPSFPKGIDIVFSDVVENAPACKTDLPYPAKRCGIYIVKCEVCGIQIALTTAGRADDPRSVTVRCNQPAPPATT